MHWGSKNALCDVVIDDWYIYDDDYIMPEILITWLKTSWLIFHVML